MASQLGQNEPRNRNPNDLNQELNEQNLLADTLVAMQRRIAEQDARIVEQIEEIWNLRQQLHVHGSGRNEGNGGNPSQTKVDDNQSRSKNEKSSRRVYGENQPPAMLEIQHEASSISRVDEFVRS